MRHYYTTDQEKRKINRMTHVTEKSAVEQREMSTRNTSATLSTHTHSTPTGDFRQSLKTELCSITQIYGRIYKELDTRNRPPVRSDSLGQLTDRKTNTASQADPTDLSTQQHPRTSPSPHKHRIAIPRSDELQLAPIGLGRVYACGRRPRRRRLATTAPTCSLARAQASLGYQRIPLQALDQYLYCREGVAF